jgi:RimJ/RimL family protein N-acetyltransferase
MVLSGDLSHTLITSARLALRAFKAADAAESFEEASATIARFMSWNPPAWERGFETIWQGHLSQMKLGTELHLVIRLNSTDEFVGRAGLHQVDGAMLETGVWIKESAQGHGYGREAVAAVIKWAGEKFRPSGFLYPVVDENTPSRKLAEALGGKIIGTRRRHKLGDKERKLLVYHIPAPV